MQSLPGEYSMDGIAENQKNTGKNWLTIGSILLIGILGSLLIVYATKWGPCVYSD